MIKPATIFNKIERLRRAICAEGNDKIMAAWLEVEPKTSKGYSTVKLYNSTNTLRKLIRSEGSPTLQDVWDAVEPYISELYKN